MGCWQEIIPPEVMKTGAWLRFFYCAIYNLFIIFLSHLYKVAITDIVRKAMSIFAFTASQSPPFPCRGLFDPGR
ncbi:hypothetical protein HMPREF0201_02389 [Cedecea davisae DSM 4568]|uniref:Uncharacterized protein n=1 Tax=Cedecea davisae DSM 4568 TaxID=566551 RepID=S3ISD5_9ENTR|nr:hypothetical protein HMPREF0201_02389 [Cedecea davisae DSM 4568]